MKKFILALLCLASVNIYASSQKIATVDIEKILQGFYRTNQVDAIIKQQGQVYQDYLNKKMGEVKKLDNDFRVELDRSQNVTLNETERELASDKAQQITNQINIIRVEMENYAKNKRDDMIKLTQKKRNELLLEINETIKKVAINQGYTIVLDASGKSTLNVPIVVYSKSNVDLTVDVLNILNKGNEKK